MNLRLVLIFNSFTGTHTEMAEDNPDVVASKFTFNTFVTAVIAGGIAGTSIDFVLFPVDSIKTRL